ncbi:hypothetical protein BpHYR1_004153 [Brachionus plicatilis]|uniref:Uncharacterized protein n=1 Tax=Brachionus plicatilis TaxID=10195 RepID=A0A3M7SXX0_BRAPC|nr:hypothetical protein BpHYR1_004153 [Brachionus plicatilis]
MIFISFVIFPEFVLEKRKKEIFFVEFLSDGKKVILELLSISCLICLKNIPYESRLKILNLTTLEERRKRGDLIQIYFILIVIPIKLMLKCGFNF